MRVLGLLLCLLFLPLAALAQQPEEEGDRGYIQGLLEDALSAPGRSVRMEGFAGALSSKATIRRITVSDADGIWLDAGDLVLVWNRGALVRGAIEIDEITIGTLDLPRRPLPVESTGPSPEAGGAFALPELPVSVNVAKAEVGRVTMGAPLFGQAAEVSVQGSASLAGGAGEAALEIARLDKAGQFTLEGGFDNATRRLALALQLSEPEDGIAANMLNLPGLPSMALSVQGDDPIDDFNADIRLATGGEERLAGRATLKTDEQGAQNFALDLGGDVAPVLVPDFAEFLGRDVRLKAAGARTPEGALALEAMSLRTAALDAQGTARIGADGWPEKLALDIRVTPPEGDSVILPVAGARTVIGGAELSLGFDAAAGEAWTATGRVDALRQDGLVIETVDFSGDGAIRREAGSVSGALTLDVGGISAPDPALARALGERLSGKLSFGWTSGAPLRLSGIDLAGEDFGLTGTLAVSGLEGVEKLTLLPDVVVRAEDASRFGDVAGLPGLRGAAELAMRGRLEPLSGLLALDFDGTTRDLGLGIARLDPLLAGAGAVTLSVTRDEQGTRVAPLLIATDHARIEGKAELRSGASTAELTVHLPEMALVLPQAKGAAEVTATARQAGDVWTIAADAALPGEARSSYRGTVAGDGREGLVAEGQLDAQIERLGVYGALIGRPLSGALTVNAKGKGDLLARTFDVEASGDGRALDVGVAMIRPLLTGTTAFAVSAARDGAGRITIRQLSANGPGTELQVSGDYGPDGGALSYSGSIANLGLLVPELPGPASVSGTARSAGADWQVEASGRGPAGITLTTSGRVAGDGARVDMTAQGAVPLALANPRLRGQALTGVAQVDLAMRGPIALSSLSGRARLENGGLAAPEMHVAVTGIRGEVTLTGGRAQVALEGNVSSGGRVRLSGPVALEPPFVGGLEADLIGVTLRDGSLYRATMDGRIGIDGPLLGGAAITGDVMLQNAELRLPQLGPSYSPLDGLQHLNPSAGVRRTLSYAGLDQTGEGEGAPLPPFTLDLRLRAPARVFVRGRGLDAELGGSLRLTGTSNDIVPVGSFDVIRGRLDLLGRRLVLTEGALRIRGSFDPVISFAATSQVEDVAVTLRIAGVASAPELTVTSVPELPEEEALSLFLFGRDVTSISAFQAVQLAAAIRTLSGKGGEGITGRIREGLGVDDFDVSTSAEGETQAKVGKYISDNVYTDVTVKSDGTSEINLNLQLNRRTVVRGKLGSDGETGVGVFFEKDY